ncbi:unnamed protein product, partial [Discosporangium mesarthrocarpum]
VSDIPSPSKGFVPPSFVPIPHERVVSPRPQVTRQTAFRPPVHVPQECNSERKGALVPCAAREMVDCNTKSGRETDEDVHEDDEEMLRRMTRRLDTAVRMVWHQYYTNWDLTVIKTYIRPVLDTIITALGTGASPEEVSRRLQVRLLERSERLDYHLAGDAPMTMYRLWLRGRPIDIYKRDLLHSPKWVSLVQETLEQMTFGRDVLVGGGGVEGGSKLPNSIGT